MLTADMSVNVDCPDSVMIVADKVNAHTRLLPVVSKFTQKV